MLKANANFLCCNLVNMVVDILTNSVLSIAVHWKSIRRWWLNSTNFHSIEYICWSKYNGHLISLVGWHDGMFLSLNFPSLPVI